MQGVHNKNICFIYITKNNIKSSLHETQHPTTEPLHFTTLHHNSACGPRHVHLHQALLHAQRLHRPGIHQTVRDDLLRVREVPGRRVIERRVRKKRAKEWRKITAPSWFGQFYSAGLQQHQKNWECP